MILPQLKNPFKILSEDEINRIHTATLDILENTGVKFLCDSALKVFKNAGLRIDNEKIVYFTPDIVEKCIRSVPPFFTRYPLDEKRYNPVRLKDGNVYFGTGSTTAYVLDLDGNYRQGNQQDIADFARLSDAMRNLEIGNGMIWAQDIPRSVFHARYIEVLAKNNGKVMPAGDGLDQKTTEDLINLVEVILGGYEEIGKKKTFTMTALPQRALTWSKEAIVVIEAAKARLPNEVCPMPLCGTMHPISLAGALVQGNAEALSGIILNQLVNNGAPVIYMTWPGITDMSAVTNVFGCPEQVLMNVGFTQIAKFYDIPSNIIVGQTDSKIPDQQAGYEKMMGMLMVALSGANEIALVGGLIDSGKVANYEQVVIDNEIAGYIGRILRGIQITENKLAIDIINEVGHGGNFLSHEHTLKYFKEEQYFTKLSDRSVRKSWEVSGSKSIRKKAVEIAREIIKNHRPSHLSSKTIDNLEKEVTAIYKREGEKYTPFIVD